MIIFEAILLTFLVAVILGFATKGRLPRYVWNRFISRSNDMADAVRDPNAESQAAIAEAQKDLMEMKSIRVDLRQEKAKAEAEVERLQHLANTWETVAKSAGERNQVEDLKQAIVKKKAIAAELQVHQSQVDEHTGYIDKLTADIEHRQAEIEEAVTSSKTLSVRIKSAQLRQKTQERLQRYNGEIQGLSRLKEDAKNAEIKLAALEEESKATSGSDSVLKKYAASEASAVSDDEMAQYLKPAPASTTLDTTPTL